MNDTNTEKITICLPCSVYHHLRQQAYKQNISLPEFIRKKIVLKPVEISCHQEIRSLASLPVREILAKTKPVGVDGNERLDFFNG